jgi:hypothetical protein
MIMSEANEVSYNDFFSNTNYGVNLFACMGGGENNTFHHNSFRDNSGGSVQAYDFSGGEFMDYWYSLVDEEGNYWSDYAGTDGNGDGIGDVPYEIDGGEGQDLYPLMQTEDSDGDGVIDSVDNCQAYYNSAQNDADIDFVGDSCDNCIFVWNPDQADSDDDGSGDVCDTSCGDVDHSGSVDIDDAVYLITYVFSGGPEPVPIESGDVDCSGGVDIDDVVYLISYIFASGPEPCADCP